MAKPRNKAAVRKKKAPSGGSGASKGTKTDAKRNAAVTAATTMAPTEGTKARRTQAERVALSDRRMFQAAIRLINANGSARTTLKQVGSEAGYSRGLANYRFGSKEEFLQALLQHFNRAWEEHLGNRVGDREGYAALVAANHALETFLQANAEYMRGGYTIWCESIGGENAIKTKLRSNHKVYRRHVTGWLQHAVDHKEITTLSSADIGRIANHYLTFVFGTIFMWLADPTAFDLTSHFEFFRAQLDNAVGA